MAAPPSRMNVRICCQASPKAQTSRESPLTTAASAVNPMATHIWCLVMRPETTARWGPIRSPLSAPETASP